MGYPNRNESKEDENNSRERIESKKRLKESERELENDCLSEHSW